MEIGEYNNINTNGSMTSLIPIMPGEGPKNLLAVPYSNPAGTEYPVIATNNYLFPDQSATTKAQVKEILNTIKSCGFNVSIWVCEGLGEGWKNLISMYYEVGALAGVRTILNISNAVPAVLQKYTETTPPIPAGLRYNPTLEEYAGYLNRDSKNSNLWGYRLKDEPNYINWGYDPIIPSIGVQDLPASYRTYLQNVNGHGAFFNLAVATSASIVGAAINKLQITNKEKYTKYLEALKDKFNPSLLSVDFYPIQVIAAQPKWKVRTDYYYYMEAIGLFSTKSNIPFWMYILSNQHAIYKEGSNEISCQYPYPSKESLRFQAMTALAFGFQGIVFWTYALPKNSYQSIIDPNTQNPYPKEIYTAAPYVNGHTTEVWDNCKEVIPIIKQYGKVLLNAKFREAKHVYGPSSEGRFSDTSELTSPIGCIVAASAKGRGFVITYLTKKSEEYIAIVNHDPYNSQEISLSIYSDFDWKEIQIGLPIESNPDESKDVNKHKSGVVQIVNRTLGPGAMILISFS